MRTGGFLPCLCALVVLSSTSLKALGEDSRRAEAPPQAAAVGYTTVTFSSAFAKDEVDTANTSGPGFKWYPYRFFGSRPRLESIRLDPSGGVTLLGDETGPNGELATATVTGASERFLGVAFGGGGYFEATFKFDPQDVIRTNFKGWPSWWSMAIEHMAELDEQQWPGQPTGYHHFIEADFFEYDFRDHVQRGELNVYGGVLHDWYGQSGKYEQSTLSSRIFAREAPAGTDFSQYHRYGFLWMPATATRDGYAEHYFDGRRIGRRVAWRKFEEQAPPPKPPWMFSIIDRNHLVLILGTGPNQPMMVKSVNVWQASDSQNLRR